MTDTLSESFCERCGTRYQFAAATRLGPLRRTRGLLSGLKTYLTTQEALSDAVGDAMRSEADRISAREFTAFHDTFNFCLTCRQYACTACWNTDAGRCRTCEPVPGQEDLPAAAPLVAAEGTPPVAEPAWPSADLDLPEPEPFLAEAEVAAEEPEPIAAVAPEPTPAPREIAPETPDPRLAWLPAAELAAAEADPPEPTPQVTLQIEIEAEAPVPPAALPPPPPAIAPAPVVESAELAAHRAKLDMLGIGGPGASEELDRPRVLPYRSRGAAVHAGDGTAAGRAASVWEESAREVATLSGAGVRACGSCSLSLSVSARFCRRCGAPQTRSA